jgi:hypothetical protein
MEDVMLGVQQKWRIPIKVISALRVARLARVLLFCNSHLVQEMEGMQRRQETDLATHLTLVCIGTAVYNRHII